MTSIHRVRHIAALLSLVLVLIAGSSVAHSARQVQAIQRIEATPFVANVMDYRAVHARVVESNKPLLGELETANTRIGEMTCLGGRLVQAYRPAPSVSRSTAGAKNNCGSAGSGCETVSGLCRTSCQTSEMCSDGFLCDTGAQQCVRRP